jgi:formylglycine-generating enzyme required for sulfatase activity
MTNCGATHESCCESPLVTGGTFFRTYDYDGGVGPLHEADPATISTFRLDKYLVTVGRFRQFVTAWDHGSGLDGGAGYVPPPGSGKHAHLNGGMGLANAGGDGGASYEPGWVAADDIEVAPTTDNLSTDCFGGTVATWTSAPADHENLPINCANWWDSYAFCIWDGGFLPTEAEMAYAAAGGGGATGQRNFPWGSAPAGTANQYAIYGCHYGGGSCSDVSNVAPVGTASLGAGAYGQLDLVGELQEFLLDWYVDAYPSPCTDCVIIGRPMSAIAYRAQRGGAFGGPFGSNLLAWARGENAAGDRDYYQGFRCARSP